MGVATDLNDAQRHSMAMWQERQYMQRMLWAARESENAAQQAAAYQRKADDEVQG